MTVTHKNQVDREIIDFGDIDPLDRLDYDIDKAGEYIASRLPYSWTNPYRAVLGAINRGKLNSKKIDNRIMLCRRDMDEFIAERKAAKHKHGTPPEKIDFTPIYEKDLWTKKSDKDLADILGCAPSTVARHREENNILSAKQAHTQKAIDNIELLRNMSCNQFSKKFNISRNTCARLKKEYLRE